MAKIRSSKDIELNDFDENSKNSNQAYAPASRSAVIDPDHSEAIDETFEEDEKEPNDDVHQRMNLVRKALLLSIAYSCKIFYQKFIYFFIKILKLFSLYLTANIGGTATLTGTGTNLVFEDIFHDTFRKSTEITFTSWFIYAFPAAVVTLIFAWSLLYVFYLMNQ